MSKSALTRAHRLKKKPDDNIVSHLPLCLQTFDRLVLEVEEEERQKHSRGKHAPGGG